ncbi:rhodanese-like domain-containing protein [Bosea sp. 117]|uniref:rhodanese-like domain-containing protein n=1 Tax=Bosea sp. 117 TaxID=1125973 RepID=UPI00049429C3|nr:rhodanese-like domain-containing protein [Bosea sp. 117]
MATEFPRIDAATLKARLMGDEEIALLDVREEGVFAGNHILAASNAPMSRFERLVPALLPRRSVPIVLADDDERLAARAGAILAANGYGDVAILKGGVPAWGAAGFELFSGVFVPSKAFGEFVEITCHTPHIDAHELHRRRAAGEDIVLLDSRPFDEYSWICIPGARDCPGGEMVLRAPAAITSDDALVVVHCGGRTRSIIGAQTLIDAGLPNRVVSLKDGTQGWHLSGYEVARGAADVVPLPPDEARDWSKQAAERLAGRFDIEVIDAATLARFEAEAGARTLYRFDVRDPREYRAGHRPGFLSAPGGQLVQATDTFIAVRQARIVLADSDGVRARATASWLARMGFDHLYVLDADTSAAALEAGDAPEAVLGLASAAPAQVTPAELADLVAGGSAVVVDVATSRQFRAGHIPGAWFAVRGRLSDDAGKLPRAPLYVLTSPDSIVARLASAELETATGAPVKVLAGGTRAWQAEGRPLESGDERMASEPNDVLLKPFERKSAQEDAMREYLSWEVGLVEQVRRDGTIRFRL